MKTTFQILRIKEIPFDINRDINITKEIMDNIELSFIFVLQYQKTTDIIGLHTVVRYSIPNQKPLLEGGITHIAQLSDWEEIKDDEEKIRKSDSLHKLISYALSFVSGVVFKQTEGTILNTAFIPHLPAEDFIQSMRIELLEYSQ